MGSNGRVVTDLDMDSLTHCATYLELQDLSNMASTCKYLKAVADSDPVWLHLFRKHWPFQASTFLPAAGIKEAYLGRHTAVRQFKFTDPSCSHFHPGSSAYTQILLDENDIILSQDSKIIVKIDAFLSGRDTMLTLRNHNARITCMRLFSLQESSLYRSETQIKENFLVTSSCDHTIRLWWKGRCQRCFRGHNCPITTLADRLLGDAGNSEKLLASGGEDGTLRLWSLTSSGKRGQHALKTTFYGHEKPISFLSVAGHKTSLLVSISKDAKVRVWDANRSSLSRSSGCVGMTSAPLGYTGSKCHEPVGMKCHESLMYVAAGSLVTAIDLRTMRKAFTSAVQTDLCSFEMLPSAYLICTGGFCKAKLWDIRKSQEKPEPLNELEHMGPIAHLHMDPYKVVTGSEMSTDIKIWDPKTGNLLNSLKCYEADDPNSVRGGCHAMAVDGCRIVSANLDNEALEHICYRDYTNATSPVSSYETDNNVSSYETENNSKFWKRQNDYDSDDDDPDDDSDDD